MYVYSSNPRTLPQLINQLHSHHRRHLLSSPQGTYTHPPTFHPILYS